MFVYFGCSVRFFLILAFPVLFSLAVAYVHVYDESVSRPSDLQCL